MWFVAVMLVSVGTGLLLGPRLGRVSEEQTADPQRPIPANRITASQQRMTTQSGANRIREHARLN
jgi:hypothetical protein